MNNLLRAGKFLYAIPIAIFGVFHFMSGPQMAGAVPVPGGIFWIYFTGLCLLAAAVCIMIGKYDKLAATLLGVLLLIFAFSIHFPGILKEETMQMSMSGFLKDTALAGAAWMYALALAKDRSVIG